MFAIALVIVGFVSRQQMPRELNPDIDFPFITVITSYPGAGPEEMETLVSKPLEKSFSSINNLKNITSSSQDSMSIIGMEYELGTDLNNAAADVRDKISQTRPLLPDDVEEPQVNKLDIASEPVMTLGLTGPLSPKELRILADELVSDRLAKVGGVASVSVSGGEQREIQVAVDRDRLQAYQLGINQIVQSIKSENMNVPAGAIKENTREYTIRTVGEFENADQIRNLRIPLNGKDKESETIRLGDIAQVVDSVKEAEEYSRINGKPSVVLTIQKQSDANTVEAAQGIKDEIVEVQKVVPEGVKLVVTQDNSIFVEDALNDVTRTLYEGIFIVAVIVLLFLHSARATFIIALAIPISILATHIPISSFGFTLNQMTLLALTLVVGILIDDSIVVLENIERHLRMREKPREAAYNGRSEIGLAAITITMVDVVVFIPVAFMGGIVGQFFRQFGITIACTTLFSLLVSFTITPMLAARWMKSEEDKEADEARMLAKLQSGQASVIDRFNIAIGKAFKVSENFVVWVTRHYRTILEWALENRFMTIALLITSFLTVIAMVFPRPQSFGPESMELLFPRIVVALIALGLCFFSTIGSKTKRIAVGFGLVSTFIIMTISFPFGFEFFPQTDTGKFTIQIRTYPGTSLEATDQITKQVEAIIDDLPELKATEDGEDEGYYITQVGSASRGFSQDVGPQYAVISVELVSKKYRDRGILDIADAVNRKASQIAGAELINVSASDGEGGPGNSLQMEVQGQDMDQILETSKAVMKAMGNAEGAINVDTSWKTGKPERRILVDRIKAAELELSIAEIAQAARTAINGDDSAKLREEGTEYPINVRFAKRDRNDVNELQHVIVASVDDSPIHLGDVAEIKKGFAPTKIDRKNRQRVVNVTAEPGKGTTLGTLRENVEKRIKDEVNIPSGISVNVGGSAEIMQESFGYMFQALLLAIILVYLLMGSLFESFLTPVVIMGSLPMALIGALLALFLSGSSFSIVVMIGIIMLVGLVTKNAMLLVDYTNTLKERGLERDDALKQAGPTRLRPILMTTLSTVGAMLPTALAVQEGSEWRAPMAITVIGGLIFSTLLTLVVIPVGYTIIDDVWVWIMKTMLPGNYKRHLENEQERLQRGEQAPRQPHSD